jgi:hypothetical protein
VKPLQRKVVCTSSSRIGISLVLRRLEGRKVSICGGNAV